MQDCPTSRVHLMFRDGPLPPPPGRLTRNEDGLTPKQAAVLDAVEDGINRVAPLAKRLGYSVCETHRVLRALRNKRLIRLERVITSKGPQLDVQAL